jgi:hypothetical protein
LSIIVNVDKNLKQLIVEKTPIDVIGKINEKPVLDSTWGWKLATSIDDTIAFLNGTAPYQSPVSTTRVCAMWKGNHPEFYVFYKCSDQPKPTRIWGWKLATDTDNVLHFLRGSGSYRHPLKEAQIAAFWKVNHREFYVFYKNPELDEQVYANWGWKLATDPSDAINFLNGTNGYSHPVNIARITALKRDGQEEFYIFYQQAAEGEPISNWTWKLATTIDDAMNFVNGKGAYEHPVKGFEIGSFWTGDYSRFYISTNKGTHIWLQSPLEDERFVQGESVNFQAVVTGEQPVDGSTLRWSSSIDGFLGDGSYISVDHLSSGTHTITVEGYKKQLTRTVRIFPYLGEFYQAQPSKAEIDRINQDFTFQLVDGTRVQEQWNEYPSIFDQHSIDPSKLVIYAKLDVLRHQDFSEPLPFTNGMAIHDHFKTFVHTLNLRLDCNFNTGGAGKYHSVGL